MLQYTRCFWPSHFDATVTYLLTTWNRVLEKLTGSQLVKKLPEFYGTRRFITMFTRGCCLSILIQINSVHSSTSHCLKIHFNIILPSTHGSSKWALSLRFNQKNPVCTSPLLHMCYMPHLSHSS